MKKIILCLAISLIFMCTLEVNASCASGARVDDEFVCLVEGATQGNIAGTAYPEDGNLVLNNYNGGSISYSSALGNRLTPITIKLVGDNYIVSEGSFGLRVPLSGVEFIGDGTLTIKSNLAIATIDFDRPNQNVSVNSNVSTIKILAGSKVNETNNITENKDTALKDTKDNDVTLKNAADDKKIDLMLILVLASCGISLVCLITVCVVLLKKKEKK